MGMKVGGGKPYKGELAISKEVGLKRDAATQKIAFLGNSGAGKTYAAGVMIELLLDQGAQVVIIDTVGNHWGLRLKASGKSPAYRIPILGGDHGDVALDPSSGKVVANTIAETRSSMIVDVSDFTLSETRRFVVDLALELLAAKKRAPSPVMVVWEECQDIVPQMVRGEDARMVGAVQRLVKRGRNYGIGTTLVSQRPAAVSKDVLNLVETVFAFRTTGRHDRKAISDWVTVNADQAMTLVDELPSLETGTCFVWSPSWLKVLQRVRINAKHTFDSTATPDFNKAAVSRTLAPVDLAKFQKRMAEAIETAKDNDPIALKSRIAVLEAEAKRAPKIQPAPEAKMKPAKRVEVPVMSRAMAKAFGRSLVRADKITAKTQSIATEFGKFGESLFRELAGLRVAFESFKGATAKSVPTPRRIVEVPTKDRPMAGTWKGTTQQRSTALRTQASLPDAKQIPVGPRAILRALIQYPDGVESSALSVMTGYKQQTRDKYTSFLVDLGLASRDRPGHTIATDSGRAAMPDAEPLPTGVDLQEHWLKELPVGERRILEILIHALGSGVTRDSITERTGYKQQTRDKYISLMAAKKIVETPSRGIVCASPVLFE